MQVQTIEMPRLKAREKFLEYRNSVRERLTDEDKQIMAGYRAIAQGKQLINLKETIRAAGANEKGLPCLAVCRADAEWCFFKRAYGRRGSYRHAMAASREAVDQPHYSRLRFSFPAAWFTTCEELNPSQPWQYNGYHKALVPIVPPALRPNHKLSNYHILWEAEWKPEPPVDPILLKKVGGDLYAVVAQWDLTDLERTVLAGRFG